MPSQPLPIVAENVIDPRTYFDGATPAMWGLRGSEVHASNGNSASTGG